jgi:TolB-like protein
VTAQSSRGWKSVRRPHLFALKEKPRNVHEEVSQLAADYIVEGSILHAGQQLRINARLVRARDDVPVWSDKFEVS